MVDNTSLISTCRRRQQLTWVWQHLTCCRRGYVRQHLPKVEVVQCVQTVPIPTLINLACTGSICPDKPTYLLLRKGKSQIKNTEEKLKILDVLRIFILLYNRNTHNMHTFVFNNKFYHQKFGTTRANPLSPFLANLFLHNLEQEIQN